MRQAGFEPTTFGSGDQHGQRTPALAVAVSRVSESRRRPSTANAAFSVTIVVTGRDRWAFEPHGWVRLQGCRRNRDLDSSAA